ncbi:hypothetical protein QDW61_06960 [Escherichia coli]|uniref:hypothetical protein n=1 Tax=Escherichia coli TaxID=562 RepID=UPI0024ACD3BC|nr:hypothetical protein [Escherichia coli]WHH44360.1 hypothetical protein QDW67_06715 [Escherichia coli]WHH89378.1 hypothetical protein QDW61_06960 [Escherichia coli]
MNKCNALLYAMVIGFGLAAGKGDALLLTFAFPVAKKTNDPRQQQGMAITDYDPFE